MFIEKIFASQPLGTIGGEGLGPMGNIVSTVTPTSGLIGVTKVLSTVIGFMTVCAGIYFIFMFLIGGYTWMTSMGDKQRLEQARDRIVNALIGLVIVIAGWSILALVGQIFNWDITISSPQNVINSLKFSN
jgi:hypothetical protein